MPGRNWRWSAFAALVIAAACTDTVPSAPEIGAARPLLNESADPGASSTATFCNPASISIPPPPFTTGPASPFPASVNVSGMGTRLVKVTATVRLMNHTFAGDVDMLLVGPTSATVMLLSDVGGGADFTNTTLTFDDDAADIVPTVPINTIVPSGTYKPTYPSPNLPDDIPFGGPPGPYGSSFAGFAETNPNGTWKLYVWDDAVLDVGHIENGWCVTITSVDAAPTADAGGPYEGDEGSLITFNGTGSTGPNGGIASYDWTFGDGATGSGPSPEHAYADNGSYDVRLVVTDAAGASSEATTTVTVNNVAPVVTSVTLPSGPIAVGTPITLGASFTDVGTGDTHTASFDLDLGGATATGTVVEGNGSGTATAVVSYAEAGVYVIRATITDDDGAAGSRSSELDVPAYVVVYDPSEGFVTGGGWISSPPGAYVPDPALTGKASFGFVAKYHKGTSTPTGNTEFHFNAGSLNFASTSYDWLVISADKAKYRGEGTINGAGRYSFRLTAIDGDKGDTGANDAFRIKIWDLATGALVYDNKLGEDEDSDASTELGGGSIVVHR